MAQSVVSDVGLEEEGIAQERVPSMHWVISPSFPEDFYYNRSISRFKLFKPPICA